MKFIPKIIPSKERKLKRFLVVDIGLGRVNLAIFDIKEDGPKFVGVGRRSFGSNDTILDATLEATDALGAIIDELPQVAMVGVSGGELETKTIVVKYKREKPKNPINQEEITAVIKKLTSTETGGDQEQNSDKRLFFSTVTGAKIDGAKITNPIGLKGEEAEISCFVAYKPQAELAIYDQIVDELEIKPEKIVPTSFAVSLMTAKKIPANSLLLRIGQGKMEAAQTLDGHLAKITNVNLGSEQLEFLKHALDSVLEKQEENERVNFVWLYADSDEVDLIEIKEELEKTDWKKKFNLKEDFKIERAAAEDNFGAADMSLLSLSLEEIFSR